ncbi:MAG: hypothetical protein CVU57_07025 [Deltaproteobacteria bacterium HGW-Deltaproteobacteria-15]|jgi:hypothetical protein|nr:MAG: hypothetical protein CVU57_07025 [Deltaproteobacteria bacterium HGW-Deltaproteobacteria-15]
MRLTKSCALAVCLCCSFASVAIADDFSLSTHSTDWTLAISAPGFGLEYKFVAENGAKMQFMSTKNKTGFSLSGSLEAGPGKSTAKECREYYWRNLKQSPFKFDQVKMGEAGQTATLEYVIKEHQGVPLNQKNVLAYCVKDDYRLYFHLSKTFYRPEDASFLESMLSKVGFIRKSQSKNLDVRYNASGERSVVLTVPQTWIDEFTQEKGQPFRTITFTQGNDMQSRLMLSPIPLEKESELRNPAILRKMIEEEGGSLLSNAVEKKIAMNELLGRAGVGYYYTLTDKTSPLPPGEYRHMTHGGLIVADVLVMFTILTNRKDSPVVAEAIQMLGSARP